MGSATGPTDEELKNSTLPCPDTTLWEFKQGSEWKEANIAFKEICTPYCAHKRNEIANSLKSAVDFQEKSDQKAVEKMETGIVQLENIKKVLNEMQKTGQSLRENKNDPAKITKKIHERIDSLAKKNDWSEK